MQPEHASTLTVSELSSILQIVVFLNIFVFCFAFSKMNSNKSNLKSQIRDLNYRLDILGNEIEILKIKIKKEI